MRNHPPTAILIVDEKAHPKLQMLLSFLDEIPHIKLEVHAQMPPDLTRWQVIVTLDHNITEQTAEGLTTYVNAGGGWLHCIGRRGEKIPLVFGAQPEPVGPFCELRVLFNDREHPLGARLPDAIYVQEHFHPLALQSDDAQATLYTDWHFQHRAVLVARLQGAGKVACTTLQDFSHPVLCQILYRLMRDMGGHPMSDERLGVGILGYAPSVGRYHGQGIVKTAGLELEAVCDLSPERMQQARHDFPEMGVHASAEALGDDPDVDAVIIATPPNTHAALALQMMAAGKHVICEKPLALNHAETSAMAEAAGKQGVHLSCHQNRRWDVDYLAIKQALAQGRIGELFYMETFVGGFSHPCGYWHSDATVSGGMTYDWGAHYIDWIVGLCPHRIDTVIGTRHKRVWHDVTNADQERIQMRFEGGLEAEFLHSDIAAVRKPKWYLLGTQGAIMGQWQDVTEYKIDPVHYFHQHDIPATEMPPELTIQRHQGAGKLTTGALLPPERPLFGFHRNLADHLLSGEPLMAPLADSMRVVAVLEAAARSMDHGGTVEVVHV